MSSSSAASGAGSIMAAPAPNFASYVPTTIRLTRSPQGMRAFNMKVPVILGPLLTETLKTAKMIHQVQGTWAPETPKLASLYEHIFNRIVPALDGHDDLLVRMGENCGTNGPLALSWLQETIDPSNDATSIQKLINIFGTSVSDSDPVSSFEHLISLNNSLAGNFHLHPVVITAILLAKLPVQHASLRDISIQHGTLPQPETFMAQLKSSIGFQSAAVSASRNPYDPSASSFAVLPHSFNQRQMLCFNCDSTKHTTKKCDKPRQACDVCGVFAGHLAKYCLVKNDKPIPEDWDDNRKTDLLSKRAAYKNMKTHSANLCIPADFDEHFPESFWNGLEHDFPRLT